MRTSKLVEEELKRNQASRNSDKVLYTNILQTLGLTLTDEQVEIIMSINPESVRRTRQKFSAKGLYLADPEIQAERQHKGHEVRQVIVGIEPTGVPELLERKPKYEKVLVDGEWIMRQVG